MECELSHVRALIGADEFAMLAQSVVERLSVRDLAELWGVPKSTVHDRLSKTKFTLANYGLWPLVNGGYSPASGAARALPVMAANAGEKRNRPYLSCPFGESSHGR